VDSFPLAIGVGAHLICTHQKIYTLSSKVTRLSNFHPLYCIPPTTEPRTAVHTYMSKRYSHACTIRYILRWDGFFFSFSGRLNLNGFLPYTIVRDARPKEGTGQNTYPTRNHEQPSRRGGGWPVKFELEGAGILTQAVQ